jgi:EmrB/QacA subfamily drug resistance transporter
VTSSATEVSGGQTRPARAASPGLVLAVVGFSVFVAADDLTVVSTMLRPIIGDLGLVLPDGLDDAAWVVNAYLIAFVAAMPLAGRLSDVIGRRRTFVGAYLCFLAGTIVIPLSVTLDEPFGWFVFGRVLSGIGGGAMVPVALAVVGDAYAEGRRARALGTLGAIETMGWVWGPLYGALLVRFLSWEWQFWLNVPLGVVGLAVSWVVLGDHDRPPQRMPVDLLGAALLTIALVSVNVALLGSAEIQSVTGLDELTGGSGPDLRWLGVLAIVAGAAFIAQQARSPHPLLDRGLVRGRNLAMALVVNFVVGAGLAIAMVDVPLFVNSVEIDLERSAVIAGWVLSALTAAMAITSYLGGRLTERTWYRPPVLAGVALATAAFAWMGATWDADAPYGLFAVQLAMLGAGFGLTVAPTTGAVVDAAPAHQRGAAASLVMVVRLLGLSVGLSALTAWGLARFEDLRSTIELPALTDPGFDEALRTAQADLTAQAIAETFTAAAVVVAVGVLAALAMRRRQPTPTDHGPISPGAPMDPTRPDPDTAPAALGPDDPTIPIPVGGAEPDRRTPSGADRQTTLLLGAMAVVVVVAAALVAVLAWQVGATRDELDATRADLARVEAGAALYASQVEGFASILTDLSPEVEAGLDASIEGLESFGNSTITVDISVDEEVPVSTEIVIDREITVPIETTIPITETFDTTIEVETPLGFSVPVDVSVPVDIEVPVDLDVNIPVNETVPIDQTFPLQLDVPVTIDVSGTELADLAASLADGLRSFRDALGDLEQPD